MYIYIHTHLYTLVIYVYNYIISNAPSAAAAFMRVFYLSSSLFLSVDGNSERG